MHVPPGDFHHDLRGSRKGKDAKWLWLEAHLGFMLNPFLSSLLCSVSVSVSVSHFSSWENATGGGFSGELMISLCVRWKGKSRTKSVYIYMRKGTVCAVGFGVKEIPG